MRRRLALLVAAVALLAACTDPAPDAPPPAVTAEVQIPGAPPAVTHGNDQLPPRPPQLAAQAPATAAWPCEGAGTEGRRVQLVYAHGGGASVAAVRATLEGFVRQIEGMFLESARATGGERLVRMVTGPTCGLSIVDAPVSASALGSFDQLITELRQQGLASDSRVYLAYTEGRAFCGIGTVYNDDRAAGNTNDQFAQYARVDRGCWDAATGAHELLHNLGAVQNSAPNATGGLHCRDEADVMCYPDGAPQGQMRQVCPPEAEDRLDCGRDDYFSTAPSPTSYLGTHWNTADAGALVHSVAPTPTTTPPPPPSSTTLPPTTSTTVGKGKTTTELVLPRTLRVDEPFLAVVQVSADPDGCRPSGVVELRVSGRLISAQVLDASGSASVKLTVRTTVDRPTIRADYTGSPTCAPSRATVRRTVRQ